MINYMISEDDTYLCGNMIPHTVGLRKEQYFIQIQYLFRFFRISAKKNHYGILCQFF